LVSRQQAKCNANLGRAASGEALPGVREDGPGAVYGTYMSASSKQRTAKGLHGCRHTPAPRGRRRESAQKEIPGNYLFDHLPIVADANRD
jgi:hypothetical protein